MKYYLDSSALVKLYVPEKESKQLCELVKGMPLPFTHFHELEVKNAIMLKSFREPNLGGICKDVINSITEDLNNEVLYRPDFIWARVFHLAIQLSVSHTSGIGCRSLDILHVAIAKTAGFSNFITYDRRQSKLAERIGLSTVI